MGEGAVAPGVLRRGVVAAPELPLGGQQALHTHWAAGVDTASRDAHLEIVT